MLSIQKLALSCQECQNRLAFAVLYTRHNHMKRAALIILALFMTLGSTPVHAATDTPKGLRVSPSRHSITTRAGETKKLGVTVTNRSETPVDVALNVQQFSVDNATQSLNFSPVKYDWVSLKENRLELQPGTSGEAQFVFNIPKNAAEGEYYFALFAGVKTETKTTRAASLAYVYVDGGNMKRQASIEQASIPPIVFGRNVPISFFIRNTGNIHLQAQSEAEISGLGWRGKSPIVHQLVVPGQSRSFEGAVEAPFFPGIYTAKYSFMDEVTKKVTTQTASIVYLPPWVIAALILIILVVVWIYQRIRRHVRPTAV